MTRSCERPPACRAPPAETSRRSPRCRPTASGAQLPYQPLGVHHRLATVRRPALALVVAEILLRVLGVVVVHVIVGQLAAGGNTLEGRDPDAAAPDAGVAIGRTRVIDEARLVAVEPRIHAGAAAQDEEERVVISF